MLMMAAPPWIPPGVVGWPPNGLSGGIHTRLLGFVKTALMRQLVPKNSLVCDLFCGRGLDTERWAEAGIGRYIGVGSALLSKIPFFSRKKASEAYSDFDDLSTSALEEAREQWEQHDRPFPAEFCELDPCMVDLEAHLQDQGLPADMVSCLGHLQDSFTSEEMVKRLLKNVEAVLKPGGFFFGTVPDSSTIWYKYQKAVQEAMKAGSLRVNGTLPAVRTDMYKITFDDDRFLAFGSKYHMRFTDDGLPPQPQLLVHFPSLIRLAKEVGLECVEIQNLMEFYDDYSGPFADVLRSCCGSLMDHKGAPVLDTKGRLNGQAMDVLSLYTTFIFKKSDSSMSNSTDLGFKASNSAAKYLTNFPCQQSGKFLDNGDEEPRRKEQDPIKLEEHVPLMLNSSPSGNAQTEQLQQESHPEDSETHVGDVGEDLSASRPRLDTWPDREEEVSEVIMHEVSPGQNIQQNTGATDNNTEGRLDGLIEEDVSKRHSGGSSRSSFQMDRPLEEGHPAGEQLLVHTAGEMQPRAWPSKEASSSDAREVSLGEREKVSPSMGHRATRDLSASGPSASAEQGQVSLMEIDSVEDPSPAVQSSGHCKERNESLDESNGVVQDQEPHLAGHNPQYSPRALSERVDESSRGEDQQEAPLADRSPKHYMRRGHEKSSRGERQQDDISRGLQSSKHYLRRSYENRDDCNIPDKQQDQQRGDHHSKRHEQRTLDTSGQTNRRNRKNLSPSKDPTSRHYERRTNDSLDDRSRNTKQSEPLGVDNSSKHYTRRTSDSSDDRHRNEQPFDEGRLQSGRSKWVGRSGLQQESNDVLQSSQGSMSSRVALKKFPANSGKPNERTAYGEDDVMTPHLTSK